MKVVTLSALCTGNLYSPVDIPGTHVCYSLSIPVSECGRKDYVNEKQFLFIKKKGILTIHKMSAHLTFKRRIKSHLPFAGIIRSSPYSPRYQDKG